MVYYSLVVCVEFVSVNHFLDCRFLTFYYRDMVPYMLDFLRRHTHDVVFL